MTLRDPELRRLDLGKRASVMIVGLGALLVTVALLVHHDLDQVAVVASTPLVLLLALAPFIAGRPGLVELRREGGSVLGTDAGPLPAGEGRVVVARRAGRRTLDVPGPIYTVDLVGAGTTRHLVQRGTSIATVRTFAEALCRLGGWPLVWRDAAGDEVRTPAELEVPLVTRLAAGGGAEPAGSAPTEPVPLRPLPGGGVEIGSTHLGPWFYLKVTGMLLAVLLASVALLAAGLSLAFREPALARRTLAAGLLTLPWRWLLLDLGLALAIVVAVDRLASSRLVVAEGEVRLRSALAGHFVEEQTLRVEDVRSLYVDGVGEGPYQLMFMGDGIQARGGRFWSLGRALAARRAVVAALLGGSPGVGK